MTRKNFNLIIKSHHYSSYDEGNSINSIDNEPLKVAALWDKL